MSVRNGAPYVREAVESILNQTMRAVEAGASAAEILEATGVAVAINGTMGLSESLRVVKVLEELGKV